MAVMSFKVWNLLVAFLVLGLLAQKAHCRPGQANEDADPDGDADYTADEPDYDDLDEDEDDEENTGPPPSFVSRPISLSLRPGDTATLPCEVQNAGSYIVLWLNGSTVVTMESEVMTKDPRIEKHKKDNKLEIRGVTPEDSGSYTCQIVAEPLLNLTHKIMVTSPPRIVKVNPSFQKRNLKHGDALTLECETAGWPEATVTWTREGKHLPDGRARHEGRKLHYDRVTARHAGTYTCEADNGIKPSATATVTINVHFAPEVTVEFEKVWTAIEKDVHLMCTVHASPNARVQWLKNGVPVEEKKHHHLTRDGSHHKYHIKKLQEGDLGKYTCQAKNSEGTVEKAVDVTGAPNVPRFITAHHMDDMTTILEWAVESFSNITGNKLMYRKKMDANWITEYPTTDRKEGDVYIIKHKVGPLEAGEYEAILSSNNKHGSTDSERLTFTGNDDIEKPSSDEKATSEEKPAAETSIGAPKPAEGSAADTRPRLLALLTIFILSSFFL